VGLVTLTLGSTESAAARIRAAAALPKAAARRMAKEPISWAALALLLPPVAALFGSVALEYAPTVGCVIVLVVLLSRLPQVEDDQLRRARRVEHPSRT
jgi:hypothetical protein